jgi:serine/threonine-protein kinase
MMKLVKTSPPSIRSAALRAGQLIGERYRLEELLERGAMGSVWRAEQTRLRSPVAVKFLDPSLIGDPEMHDRFMQEARSAAAVRSVHVVQIFDYGSEGGVPYIAMELLDGENLDTRLASCGTLTPLELNKIFGEVARGIGQAHALGVVHRDVKPGNIFIAREGEHEVTKLIDFGIAKVKADALKFTQIVGTQLGTLLGTPQYMSPEQVRGSSTVDHRTDLWALAIIACECLTGRYPFPGTTIGDLAVQICTEKPRAPSTLGPVPAGFDQWFFKGTSKKPSKRFASVDEMAAALNEILSASVEGAPAIAWSERLVGPLTRIEVRRAWAATSSQVSQLSVLTRRAIRQVKAGIWAFAAVLRADAVALAQSERFDFARPLWSRTGLLASLLIVLCGLALAWLPRRGAPAAGRQEGLSQAVQAALPVAPVPAATPLPSTAAPAPAGDLEPVALPLPSEDAVLPSEPALGAAPAAAPRRSNKRRLAPSPHDTAAPLGPMGRAMGRAGARIMQGDAKRRETPATVGATAPAPALARQAPVRAPAPAAAQPSPKAAPRALSESEPRPARADGRH